MVVVMVGVVDGGKSRRLDADNDDQRTNTNETWIIQCRQITKSSRISSVGYK